MLPKPYWYLEVSLGTELIKTYLCLSEDEAQERSADFVSLGFKCKITAHEETETV